MNYIGSLICSLIIIIIIISSSSSSSSSSISAASILLHVNHATRTIIEAVFIVLRTKELTHTTTTVWLYLRKVDAVVFPSVQISGLLQTVHASRELRPYTKYLVTGILLQVLCNYRLNQRCVLSPLLFCINQSLPSFPSSVLGHWSVDPAWMTCARIRGWRVGGGCSPLHKVDFRRSVLLFSWVHLGRPLVGSFSVLHITDEWAWNIC